MCQNQQKTRRPLADLWPTPRLEAAQTEPAAANDHSVVQIRLWRCGGVCLTHRGLNFISEERK